MKRHRIVTLFSLLLMCLLSGCFQVERTVVVKPDGSAMVEETFLMSKKALQAMSEAFGEKGSAKQPDDDFGLEDPKKLKAAASSMGEGVSFVRSEKISSEQFAGYKAFYSVADINKLTLSSAPPKVNGKQEKADPSRAARFVFTPGDTATLQISSPRPPTAKKAAEKTVTDGKLKNSDSVAKPESKPQPPAGGKDMEMLRQFFEGMRFALSVRVEGEIVETNATHREGETVVLADIDFGKLLSIAPDELAKLSNAQNGDMQQAMEMLKHLPGVKVDLNEQIRIRFR
ncbi:MAG TPA: hypothetical protein PLN25_09935 [Deltaproteobacteria bacterium]|nr:hypothetical protein [Deltaproteobacteria bacterium]HQB38621.1 hypothetical protein [Deltaproteobacteria bacterium]